MAQVSIQILELIYECNFQIDTNAAPPAGTGTKYEYGRKLREQFIKGGAEVLPRYKTLYVSYIMVLIVTN